ncbi:MULTISPECIES: MarR family winged helix-turn-helix transcriptional regulator [Pantoea]|uniref:MarR family winged helix-turn-helix transcriptional regulator n=1 Tax=Pantoea TaxID=53335 RepID=UPI0007373D2B|nr:MULTISPECIES: MarR family transcriptional regulator [Pantoea]KAA6103825.1 MarR family transcriptional regulator [Pantoea sp. B_9]KAA6116034.1 MarR family transcriptional regulator [Pantoea sp. B_10]KAA8672218.1 MarR family transcriptional regulator [Pantoea dispersa]KAF0854365.1 MarR family transcriptional regulator [Pantoea dispersa 625]KTS16623.1 MarR family transcriptional regulator [Pantoea dispersa]
MTDHPQPFSRLLHLTAHAWRLAVDRRLKESGLSMSSWLAIASVATASEPPTQKALAQLLGLEEASVVPLVDRLVKQQLLARVQPKEDRRKRLLVLTEQGGEAFATVKTQADALRAQLLADIDPAALAVTENVLQQLLERLGNV